MSSGSRCKADQPQQQGNSLEGVGAARRDLLAGGALPDSGHLALGGVLAAEGASVLGVLGDLLNRDRQSIEYRHQKPAWETRGEKQC